MKIKNLLNKVSMLALGGVMIFGSFMPTFADTEVKSPAEKLAEENKINDKTVDQNKKYKPGEYAGSGAGFYSESHNQIIVTINKEGKIENIVVDKSPDDSSYVGQSKDLIKEMLKSEENQNFIHRYNNLQFYSQLREKILKEVEGKDNKEDIVEVFRNNLGELWTETVASDADYNAKRLIKQKHDKDRRDSIKSVIKTALEEKKEEKHTKWGGAYAEIDSLAGASISGRGIFEGIASALKTAEKAAEGISENKVVGISFPYFEGDTLDETNKDKTLPRIQKKKYYSYERLKFDDLSVKLKYSDSTTKVVAYKDFKENALSMNYKNGDSIDDISYNGRIEVVVTDDKTGFKSQINYVRGYKESDPWPHPSPKPFPQPNTPVASEYQEPTSLWYVLDGNKVEIQKITKLGDLKKTKTIEILRGDKDKDISFGITYKNKEDVLTDRALRIEMPKPSDKYTLSDIYAVKTLSTYRFDDKENMMKAPDVFFKVKLKQKEVKPLSLWYKEENGEKVGIATKKTEDVIDRVQTVEVPKELVGKKVVLGMTLENGEDVALNGVVNHRAVKALPIDGLPVENAIFQMNEDEAHVNSIDIGQSSENPSAGYYEVTFNQRADTPVAPEEYTVTIKSDDEELGALKVKKGDKVSKEDVDKFIPVKEGYIFKGWFNEDTLWDFDAEINKDLTLKAIWEVKPADKPSIIESTKKVKHGEEATFKSDGDIKDFQRVLVDNKELSEKDYTVKSGSTIVTLNKDFINGLEAGIHTIGIVSTNGTAEDNFLVEKTDVVPPASTGVPSKPEDTVEPTKLVDSKNMGKNTSENKTAKAMKDKSNPQTGDNNTMVISGILALAGIGAISIIATRKRKNNK